MVYAFNTGVNIGRSFMIYHLIQGDPMICAFNTGFNTG